MKTIGLIGGMSWESSLEYYRLINQLTKQKLGGLHSAKCILYSFDFSEIEQLQSKADWSTLTNKMLSAAKRLEQSGAECLVICTNTMHLMADEIQQNCAIPLLHIVDAVAEKILLSGLRTVGLLGTRFMMERDFYKRRLKEKFNINVITPDISERQVVHQIIYEELCQGVLRDTSKKEILSVISSLVERGAQGVVLGCTEIPLLIKQADVSTPVFDTTAIHAQKAVDFSLT